MKKSKKRYIYGKKPVEEYLLDNPKGVISVLVKDSIKDASLIDLKAYIKKHRIPLMKVPGKKITALVGDVNHQGVIAEVEEFVGTDFHEWVENLEEDKNHLVLVMDELTDPHNTGAIIRTAAAVGASGVILSKHRQAPINATVFKTSAGAVTKIPIIIVSNITYAIENLKKHSFWVAGLTGDADKTVWDENFDSRMAVVVGSEGEGLHRGVLDACDYALSLPMENNVESLNASVSAAVVSYEWKRKQN